MYLSKGVKVNNFLSETNRDIVTDIVNRQIDILNEVKYSRSRLGGSITQTDRGFDNFTTIPKPNQVIILKGLLLSITINPRFLWFYFTMQSH